MVLTEAAREHFASIQFRVRKATIESPSAIPYIYEDEPFFTAYEVITKMWKSRIPQRNLAENFSVSRNTLQEWDQMFAAFGAVGILPEVNSVPVDSTLERLVILIKTSRPHERANYTLRLANALEIPGATLEIIRQIQ